MSQLIAKQVTKKNMQKGSIQPTSPELEINSQIFEKFRTWLSLKSEFFTPWRSWTTQQASTTAIFHQRISVQEVVPGGAGQHNKLVRRLYFTREP